MKLLVAVSVAVVLACTIRIAENRYSGVLANSVGKQLLFRI